jgi:hypothetical protein
MQARTLLIGILAPLVLISAACRDEPVRPGDRAVDASMASQPGPNADVGSPAVGVYRVSLSPLNGSGVHGTATIQVKGSNLVVELQALGHVPDLMHLQHIHGFTDGTDATCPPPEAAGGDGVLSFADGLPFYGPVQLLLTPFPTPANSAGAFHYRGTFPQGSLAFDASDLELKTMVLHGDFVGGDFDASLPVACGVVERVN